MKYVSLSLLALTWAVASAVVSVGIEKGPFIAQLKRLLVGAQLTFNPLSDCNAPRDV